MDQIGDQLSIIGPALTYPNLTYPIQVPIIMYFETYSAQWNGQRIVGTD